MDQLNLSQIVNFTTRKSNILDLILTNRPGLTERCEPDIGFSDHETAIIADIFCHPQKIKPVQRKVNHRAEINALQNDIKNEIDKFCTSNTTETDINISWESFKQIIFKAQEKHVPTKTTSKCFSQPWFNAVCKKAVRKKKQRYRVYKRTKLDRDWSKFQEAAKNARKVCQKTYHEYVKNNIGEGKGNNKKFYTFVKTN